MQLLVICLSVHFLMCFPVAFYAQHNKRCFIRYFVFAVLTTPIIALLVVGSKGKSREACTFLTNVNLDKIESVAVIEKRRDVLAYSFMLSGVVSITLAYAMIPIALGYVEAYAVLAIILPLWLIVHSICPQHNKVLCTDGKNTRIALISNLGLAKLKLGADNLLN